MSDKHKRQINRCAQRIHRAEEDLIQARKYGDPDEIAHAEWWLDKTKRMAEKTAKLISTFGPLNKAINNLNTKYGR